MQILAERREVETNLTSQQSFRINSNAKMFSILADKIYTDKLRAVIREICCNALDIHNQIGQTRPFLIALPSPTEPMLSIRDYGTGLSHEDMVGLYTTFFDSTKSGDNDQIGGFGLGSKSPFAYTDAFTVTSYQAGEKRVYACFRGADNVPAISLAHEAAYTDEPDGLEVKVPIKQEDFVACRRRAEDILRWFPAGSFTPFGFDAYPVTPTTLTDTYMVIPNEQVDRHQVLMGPVAYNLDWYQVDPEIDLPDTIVPIFQVGELDLPPSREAISYDPLTISRLRARATDIITSIVPELIDAAMVATPVARLKMLDDWRTSGLSGLFDQYHKAVGHRAADDAARKADGTHTFRNKWGIFLAREFEEVRIPAQATTREWRAGRRGAPSRIEKTGSYKDTLVFDTAKDFDDQYIIFHDLEGVNAPRLMDRLGELDRRRKYHLVYASETIASIGDIRALLPDAPDDMFLTLSEIEPPKRTAKKLTSKCRLFYGRHNGRYTNFHVDYEIRVAPDSGVWLPFDGPNPVSAMVSVANLGWYDDKIWGLSKRAQKECLNDDWTRIDDLVRERAAAALTEEVITAWHAQHVIRRIHSDPLFAFLSARPNLDLLPVAVEAVRAVRLDALLADETLIHRLDATAERGLLTLPKLEDRHGIQRLLKQVAKKNPSLVFLLQVEEGTKRIASDGSQDNTLKSFIRSRK